MLHRLIYVRDNKSNLANVTKNHTHNTSFRFIGLLRGKKYTKQPVYVSNQK